LRPPGHFEIALAKPPGSRYPSGTHLRGRPVLLRYLRPWPVAARPGKSGVRAIFNAKPAFRFGFEWFGFMVMETFKRPLGWSNRKRPRFDRQVALTPDFPGRATALLEGLIAL